MSATLILYMGNPIVRNDQIGLLVGSRLASLFSGDARVTVAEFTGSPLDLVSQAGGYEQLILIDSVATGENPVGSVTLFDEREMMGRGGDLYPHGMNLPEAIALARRLGAPFPARLHLIGIETGIISEFGEGLSAGLIGKLESIHREVRRLLTGLTGSPG